MVNVSWGDMKFAYKAPTSLDPTSGWSIDTDENKITFENYSNSAKLRYTNAYGNVGLKINSAIGYTYKFTYKFAGDSYYGPSSGSINLRIKKATTLTGSPSTILRGTAYKVTLKEILNVNPEVSGITPEYIYYFSTRL